MTDHQAFQDEIPGNHCFGCGSDNHNGLRIKSFWSGIDEAVCEFSPAAHHCAGPSNIVNGGILATLIDCHSVCTATAAAYKQAEREIGSDPHIWFATGSLNVDFLRPTPLGRTVVLRAHVDRLARRKAEIICHVYSGDVLCARGNVLAVRVPSGWTARLGRPAR